VSVRDTNPANRRRSERVILQVPVPLRGNDRDGKTLEEETHTSVVNAHGGLLKLHMGIKTGQPILLINLRTKEEQSCRVVRVETSLGGQSAVAFEFDQPAPHFWPITFPPEDWIATA
jgi:hypothetical protein